MDKLILSVDDRVRLEGFLNMLKHGKAIVWEGLDQKNLSFDSYMRQYLELKKDQEAVFEMCKESYMPHIISEDLKLEGWQLRDGDMQHMANVIKLGKSASSSHPIQTQEIISEVDDNEEMSPVVEAQTSEEGEGSTPTLATLEYDNSGEVENDAGDDAQKQEKQKLMKEQVVMVSTDEAIKSLTNEIIDVRRKKSSLGELLEPYLRGLIGYLLRGDYTITIKTPGRRVSSKLLTWLNNYIDQPANLSAYSNEQKQAMMKIITGWANEKSVNGSTTKNSNYLSILPLAVEQKIVDDIVQYLSDQNQSIDGNKFVYNGRRFNIQALFRNGIQPGATLQLGLKRLKIVRNYVVNHITNDDLPGVDNATKYKSKIITNIDNILCSSKEGSKAPKTMWLENILSQNYISHTVETIKSKRNNWLIPELINKEGDEGYVIGTKGAKLSKPVLDLILSNKRQYPDLLTDVQWEILQGYTNSLTGKRGKQKIKEGGGSKQPIENVVSSESAETDTYMDIINAYSRANKKFPTDTAVKQIKDKLQDLVLQWNSGTEKADIEPVSKKLLLYLLENQGSIADFPLTDIGWSTMQQVSDSFNKVSQLSIMSQRASQSPSTQLSWKLVSEGLNIDYYELKKYCESIMKSGFVQSTFVDVYNQVREYKRVHDSNKPYLYCIVSYLKNQMNKGHTDSSPENVKSYRDWLYNNRLKEYEKRLGNYELPTYSDKEIAHPTIATKLSGENNNEISNSGNWFRDVMNFVTGSSNRLEIYTRLMEKYSTLSNENKMYDFSGKVTRTGLLDTLNAEWIKTFSNLNLLHTYVRTIAIILENHYRSLGQTDVFNHQVKKVMKERIVGLLEDNKILGRDTKGYRWTLKS